MTKDHYVWITRSTTPGSHGYTVRWNAGPLTQIGAAGYADVDDHNTAVKFAQEKATKLNLSVVDETDDTR